MKIKIQSRPYLQIMEEYKEKHEKHRKPEKPNIFFRTLLKLVSLPDLLATHFKCERVGMERLGKKEPAFFLMNHSSFIDLEIVSSILYPRPFNIVATTDGFIGKDWLMRQIGCIPTKKFVTDTTLVRDMLYTTKKLRDSIVMYPEASYSFDGTATPLPESIGKCVKMLDIPLVMIRTYGAFTRDPLYNNLQRRRVDVSAKMEYLLSPEEMAKMTEKEIYDLLCEKFSFDNFKWQQENGIKVKEPFRADGLNRILYKCPNCKCEHRTLGKGVHIECLECGKKYYLNEDGFLEATEGVCEFPHIPDWYKWERECVREELLEGRYLLDVPVDILVSVDTKNLYSVGEGRLVHNSQGFHLTSEEAGIDYSQKPLSSYSLYSDFNWYEVGDVICIGDGNCLYYCLPKVEGDHVAKARLAAEELYKIEKAKHDESSR